MNTNTYIKTNKNTISNKKNNQPPKSTRPLNIALYIKKINTTHSNVFTLLISKSIKQVKTFLKRQTHNKYTEQRKIQYKYSWQTRAITSHTNHSKPLKIWLPCKYLLRPSCQSCTSLWCIFNTRMPTVRVCFCLSNMSAIKISYLNVICPPLKNPRMSTI